MEGKITTQLSRTGPYFQSYIRRGLANIATEEEEKERANVIAEVKNLCMLLQYNKKLILLTYHKIMIIIFSLVPQNSNNNAENNIIQTEGIITIAFMLI